jgi:hypothetical protein
MPAFYRTLGISLRATGINNKSVSHRHPVASKRAKGALGLCSLCTHFARSDCEQRSGGRRGLCSFARRGFAAANDFARLLASGQVKAKPTFARLLARPSAKAVRIRWSQSEGRAGGVMVRMIFLLMLSLRSGRRLLQNEQSNNSSGTGW